LQSCENCVEWEGSVEVETVQNFDYKWFTAGFDPIGFDPPIGSATCAARLKYGYRRVGT